MKSEELIREMVEAQREEARSQRKRIEFLQRIDQAATNNALSLEKSLAAISKFALRWLNVERVFLTLQVDGQLFKFGASQLPVWGADTQQGVLIANSPAGVYQIWQADSTIEIATKVGSKSAILLHFQCRNSVASMLQHSFVNQIAVQITVLVETKNYREVREKERALVRSILGSGLVLAS